MPPKITAVQACGADFISTMYHADSLVGEAKRLRIPVLGGVLRPLEAIQSACKGASALKVFPASSIGPGGLHAVFNALQEHCIHTPPLFVAGGISVGDVAAYASVGADGFAVGVDCDALSPQQVINSLYEYLAALEKAEKRMKNRIIAGVEQVI